VVGYMEFSVREAMPSDYDGLCEVFAEVDALHRDGAPSVFRKPDGPVRSWGHILKILTDENAALFVAQSGDRIVGLVVILLREASDIPILVPRRYAHVESLAVREGYRHLGIGRALMERAHEWAQDSGVTEVQLSVWEFNQEAIAFYERLGYRAFMRRMWRRLT
jgi:ribosomal protein S18 acetylase RimI-like enzyme